MREVSQGNENIAQYETKILPITQESIAYAAKLLKQGELVAIPTETVYGLAANALDEMAVAKIFSAKGRPQDNPLISHVSDLEMAKTIVSSWPKDASVLASAFWPGPLTMVLPANTNVAANVCAGLSTVGIRMPSHPAALAVIKAAKVPLAAPSANVSGSPSPTTAQHVYHDLKGRIPLILDGGNCSVGVESTVLSIQPQIKILRPGYVTETDIQTVLNKNVLLSEAITKPLGQGQAAESPGMKYRHYAPVAEITIIESDFKNYKKYVESENNEGVYALCFTGEGALLDVPFIEYGCPNKPEEQAIELFSALRKLDEIGAKKVFARSPSKQGVGLAVYNRLLRAAGFRVIKK